MVIWYLLTWVFMSLQPFKGKTKHSEVCTARHTNSEQCHYNIKWLEDIVIRALVVLLCFAIDPYDVLPISAIRRQEL